MKRFIGLAFVILAGWYIVSRPSSLPIDTSPSVPRTCSEVQQRGGEVLMALYELDLVVQERLASEGAGALLSTFDAVCAERDQPEQPQWLSERSRRGQTLRRFCRDLEPTVQDAERLLREYGALREAAVACLEGSS